MENEIVTPASFINHICSSESNLNRNPREAMLSINTNTQSMDKSLMDAIVTVWCKWNSTHVVSNVAVDSFERSGQLRRKLKREFVFVLARFYFSSVTYHQSEIRSVANNSSHAWKSIIKTKLIRSGDKHMTNAPRNCPEILKRIPFSIETRLLRWNQH